MSLCALRPAMFPRFAAGCGTAAVLTVALCPAPHPPHGPRETVVALLRSAIRLGRAMLPPRVRSTTACRLTHLPPTPSCSQGDRS